MARDGVAREIARTVQTERGDLAMTIDAELHALCGREAAARHELGQAARPLLAGRGYHRLGFVHLGDYAHERLGVSARTVECAAWVAARLEALPLIADAFARRELSWTQVRALCRGTTAGTEREWLARARHASARELEALADAVAPAAAARSDPDAEDGTIDGEPAVRFRLACPARVRALWRRAIELASRMAGASLVPWRAVELVAAEALSGRPEDGRVGDRALLAALRRCPSDGPSAMAAGTPAGSDARAVVRNALTPVDRNAVPRRDVYSSEHAATSGADETSRPLASPPPHDPAAHDPSGHDPFALDVRLREAMRAIRRAEPRIGQRLRLLVDLKLYRCLGCASVATYVRERLGISPRKAWALLKVERTAQRTSAFARAYREGALTWTRAATLLPVLERRNEDSWIARAAAVTAQRLADEVAWALEQRDAFGPDVPLDPPPLDGVLVSPAAEMSRDECQKMAPEAPVRGGGSVQNGAGPRGATLPNQGSNGGSDARAAELCDVEVAFTAPASVVALLRDTMDAFARPGEPRWAAFESVVRHAVWYWEELGRHRDPVFARDGWRCACLRAAGGATCTITTSSSARAAAGTRARTG